MQVFVRIITWSHTDPTLHVLDYIYIYVHASFDILTAASFFYHLPSLLFYLGLTLLFYFLFCFVCFISLFPSYLFIFYALCFIPYFLFSSHHTLIFFILFFCSLIPTLTQFPAY